MLWEVLQPHTGDSAHTGIPIGGISKTPITRQTRSQLVQPMRRNLRRYAHMSKGGGDVKGVAFPSKSCVYSRYAGIDEAANGIVLAY